MSDDCDECNKLWDEWVGLTNPEPAIVTTDWLANIIEHAGTMLQHIAETGHAFRPPPTA